MRTRRATTRKQLWLAPRHALEAEFAQRATDGFDGSGDRENNDADRRGVAGGNIDDEELEELWGPGSRDVDGSAGVCRSVDDFFEKDGIEEVALTDEPEGATVGERLRRGEVVLRVEGACTIDDCNFCTASARRPLKSTGLSMEDHRPMVEGGFAVADSEAFDFDVVSNAEAVFLNVLDALDAKMPDIYDQLFAPGQDWVARQPLTGPRSNQMDRPRPDESLSQRCPDVAGPVHGR